MAVEPFDYTTMTSRNLGLVTASEQERLRTTPVFVCGTGGMGGACVQALARLGLSRLALVDIDRFEVSNLNRQVFAFLRNVGQPKVDGTVEILRDINPDLEIETYGRAWVDELDRILTTYKIVVNGMDDLEAGIRLYRKAREHGATVIDAYLSPIPSIIVVRPEDPRPEERLGYPTVGRTAFSPQMRDACRMREVEYVMVHSSSAKYIDLAIAGEIFAGTRSRPSFAPMVITTGNLMCFEVVNLVLGRPSGTDCRGVFYDPWRAEVQRPRGAILGWLISRVVRRKLRDLLG